jgi:hypothetical protein
VPFVQKTPEKSLKYTGKPRYTTFEGGMYMHCGKEKNVRIPSVFKILSPAILLVFIFAGCTSPFFSSRLPANSETVAEIIVVPLGLGDIKVHYLDSSYQPTTTDIGITVLVVENNEMASGVLVLAEVAENNVENGSVVRVVNTNNESLVSMFYYEGQKFPHKMVITKDDITVQAQFTQYNMTNQNFSLTLEYEGESGTIDDIGMNINVLTLYHFQDELTESQNVRIQNIVISLAIWDCIALQIPGFDFTVLGIIP